MQHILVGASGGIGRALLACLLENSQTSIVHATWRSTKPSFEHPKLRWYELDASDESQVSAFAALIELAVAEQSSSIRYFINAAGVLHSAKMQPEKSLSALTPAAFMESLGSNALPSLLLAKHFSPLFRRQGPMVFAVLSAKVGSIADNRLGGWYSYRSSKAALNMAMKTLSIEWRRTHNSVCVAVLHPGTTETALSEPFARNVPAQQLFSVEKTAGLLLTLLATLDSAASGKFWAFDGEELPW